MSHVVGSQQSCLFNLAFFRYEFQTSSFQIHACDFWQANALLWQNSDLQSLVLNFDGPAVFIRKMLLQGRPCRPHASVDRPDRRAHLYVSSTSRIFLHSHLYRCRGLSVHPPPHRALFPHRGPSPVAPCPSPTVLHPITGHAAPQHPRADDARRLWQSSSRAAPTGVSLGREQVLENGRRSDRPR